MLVPWKREREECVCVCVCVCVCTHTRGVGVGSGEGRERCAQGRCLKGDNQRLGGRGFALTTPASAHPGDLSVQTLIRAASSDKSYINRQPT